MRPLLEIVVPASRSPLEGAGRSDEETDRQVYIESKARASKVLWMRGAAGKIAQRRLQLKSDLNANGRV